MKAQLSFKRKLLIFCGVLALLYIVFVSIMLVSNWRLCHIITISDDPVDIIIESAGQKECISSKGARHSALRLVKLDKNTPFRFTAVGTGPVFFERIAFFGAEPFFPRVAAPANVRNFSTVKTAKQYPAADLRSGGEQSFVLSDLETRPFFIQLKSCIAAALIPMAIFFWLLNFQKVTPSEKRKFSSRSTAAAVFAGVFIYLYIPVFAIFQQGTVSVSNYLFYAVEIAMLCSLAAWWITKYPVPENSKKKLLSIASSGALLTFIFITMLVVMADACCMLATKSGFNFVYMVHLERTTPHMVFGLYPQLCVVVYIYFILLPAVLWGARFFALKYQDKACSGKAAWQLPAIGAAALICAFILPAPFNHAFNYCRMQILQRGDMDPDEAKEYLVRHCGLKDIGAQSPLQASPGKNLICIFMESMDAAYMEEEHFPWLTRNLKRLANAPGTINFTNINSMGLTTDFTFNSFYSLFMGFPLTDLFYHGVDISDRQRSVPEILKAAGYYTQFLEAGNVSLAGEDSFFKQCKIDHFYDSFSPVFKNAWNKEWGIHDDTLLDQLYRDFENASSKHKNFALFAATIAPHAPNGYKFPEHVKISYKGCSAYPQSHLLNAVHAEDMWIGCFVDRVLKHPAGKDTVILLVTDHPLQFYIAEPHQKRNLYNEVLANRDKRKLIALAVNTGTQAQCQTEGMLFDFAPTLLNILNVKHNQQFFIAEDLLSGKGNPNRMNIVMPHGKILLNQYLAASAPKLTEKNICVFQDGSKAMIKVGNMDIPLFSKQSSTGWHGYQRLPEKDETIALELNRRMNKTVKIHRSKNKVFKFSNSIELYGPDAKNEYRLLIRENGKIIAETKNADANKLLIPASK